MPKADKFLMCWSQFITLLMPFFLRETLRLLRDPLCNSYITELLKEDTELLKGNRNSISKYYLAF